MIVGTEKVSAGSGWDSSLVAPECASKPSGELARSPKTTSERMEKARNDSSLETGKSSEQERGHSVGAKGQEKSTLLHSWTYVT